MLDAQGAGVLSCDTATQVEHPVTEWISGVNIPSCQLMIGMGVPLNRIPDIRRLYGQDPKGTSQIDYDKDPQIPPSGARLSSRFPGRQLGSAAHMRAVIWCLST